MLMHECEERLTGCGFYCGAHHGPAIAGIAIACSGLEEQRSIREVLKRVRGLLAMFREEWTFVTTIGTKAGGVRHQFAYCHRPLLLWKRRYVFLNFVVEIEGIVL